MKKTLCLILILAVMLALCACGHSAITPEAFASAMEEKGYEVETADDHFSNGGTGYVAADSSGSFNVIFGRWDAEDDAVQQYRIVVNNLDTMGGTSTSVNSGSFGCTTRNYDGAFFIVSHVGNTFMFGQTSSDQADAMKDLFKSLGYK